MEILTVYYQIVFMFAQVIIWAADNGDCVDVACKNIRGPKVITVNYFMIVAGQHNLRKSPPITVRVIN